MKKIKEMSDEEFGKKITEVVGSAVLFEEVLSYQAPYESKYGSFLFNFNVSLCNYLSDDVITFSRSYYDENRMALLLYFDVEKIKIYCILRDDEASGLTKINIAMEGNQEDIVTYCEMINEMFDRLIKEIYDIDLT